MRVLQKIVRATARFISTICVAVATAFSPRLALADTVIWRELPITYTGAEVKTVGNDELLLIYRPRGPPQTLTLPEGVDINVRILAVGGGGGGGTIKGSTYSSYAGGGGGGAGEFVEREGLTFNGDSFTFTVGEGGTGGEGDGSAAVAAKAQGGNGSASIILKGGNPYLTAVGGGGGGGQAAGSDGGSGGGSSAGSSAITDGGASLAADGLGNAGGGSIKRYGGGGGGANAAGAPGVDGIAGAGGDGKMSDITGIEETYAGGGGGGCTYSGKTAGAGGAGGGGLGAGVTKTTIPTAGEDGKGGGGGGGSRYWPGQKGGSGIIIIRLTGIVKPLVWVELTGLPQGWSKIEVATEPKVEWKNGELLLTYTNVVDACGFRVPEGLVQARTLVIGGGGAGGTGYNSEDGFAGPGGGGAGGFVEAKDLVMSGEYKITVGAGGAAAKDKDSDIAKGKPGEDGKYSQIARSETDTYFYNGGKADGGGGGGAWHDNGDGTYSSGDGRDGASGGGGSAYIKDGEVVSGEGGKGTAGQGHDGATGSNKSYNVGAGGGGAGGEPLTIAADRAPGGDGKTSNITGEEIYYAGGGGGSQKSSNNGNFDGGKGGGGQGGKYYSDEIFTAPTAGVDGLGGGGGGGIKNRVGGKGGDGVVIIRIKACVPFVVPVPTGHEFTYDGTEKQGVDDSAAYNQGGQARATNADNYITIVTINPDLPDIVVWDDAEGGRGERKIPWAIHQLKVHLPIVNETPRAGYFTFGNAARNDEEEKLAIDGYKWLLEERDQSVYPGETCATNVMGQALPYCTLTGHRETNAGRYHYTATLVKTDPQGHFATNFIWSTGSLLPREVAWKIETAENKITGLAIKSWQEGTAAKKPSCDWQWRKTMERYPESYPHPDVVTYQWRTKPREGSPGRWSDPKPLDELEMPTEAGLYQLRAFICADSNHTEDYQDGNWEAAEDFATFLVWRHPSKTFADWVDIRSTGCAITDAGSGLTDFPVLVRLRDPVDGGKGGGIPGFRHADVRQNGLELRFVSVSNLTESAIDPADVGNPLARDTLLPFEVDTWNPRGESLVWVKVPKVYQSAQFRMYWRLRDGATVPDDLEASETWANGYVGVWHLNATDKEGRLPNSTSLGSALAATGTVKFVNSKAGKAALVTADSLVAPNYEPFLSTTTLTPRFTFTGWYQGKGYASDDEKMDVLFLGKKLGGQASNPWDYKDGWGWRYYRQTNADDPRPLAYFSGNQTADWKKKFSLVTTPRFLAMATDTTGNKSVYYDGVLQNSYNKNLYTNALPFQIARDKFAADEVRIAKVMRSAAWIKAEYESVTNESFCTFGLVNKLQGTSGETETRVWVNWWSVEPWTVLSKTPGTEDGKYWRKDTPPKLDPTAVTNDFGRLAKIFNADESTADDGGTIFATYVKMPSQEKVVFPTDYGPYAITFTMANMDEGTKNYPGPHILYDNDRQIDIEIVTDRPEPIDPTGGGGSDAVNLRVLLANDDVDGRGAGNAVSNQSYFVWAHDNQAEPPKVLTNVTEAALEVLTNSLLKGTAHALTNSQGKALWTLRSAYLGNMMAADPDAERALVTGQRALTWSATSRNSTADPADYDLPLMRRGVGQIVLRNAGDDPGEPGIGDASACALIRSPWYTNGVGTIYFDAVNAFTTNAAAFRLQVEVSTNAFNDVPAETDREYTNVVWTLVRDLRKLKYDGSKFTSTEIHDGEVTLDVADGDGLNRFYRIIAPVPAEYSRLPCRFRIRRTSMLGAESSENVDDWHGFIVVDNVIASWPTEVVSLDTRGWYDARKSGRQVLGWETALSVNYPSAAETDLRALVAFVGNPANITSARCHYRWRYLDAAFRPERTPAGEEFRDNFTVVYLDPADGFRSVAPFDLPGIAGDLEYWFDLTAIAPFYSYCDYSGATSADPTAGYTENPEKGVTSRRKESEGILPSRGTDWFVRLREGASVYESFRACCTYTLRDEYGRESPGAQEVDLVLAEDHLWRGYLRTSKEMAGRAAKIRFEARTPEAPGSSLPKLRTTYLSSSSGLPTKDDVPGSLILAAASSNDTAEVWIDAATGHVMFQLDDRTLSLTVTHADYQDFNGWSDAVSPNDPPLFTGTSIEGPGKKGTSSKTVRVTEAFDRWTDTPETKDDWRLTFGGATIDADGRPGWVPFSTATFDQWTANNGQWVARYYHPVDATSREQSGLAVELFGAQNGNLQIVNPLGNPRGVGKVSYTARVAQPIDFFDFNTSVTEANLTNYTFVTRAAFDLNKNKNFAGNASLSLVAFFNQNYRTGYGCYEARWEQLKGTGYNAGTGAFSGPLRNNQRLCLYRWMRGTSGEIDVELVGAYTNTMFNIPETNGKTGGYMPFFISAYTDPQSGNTTVSAGVLRSQNGITPGSAISGNWVCINYVDDKDGHPKGGTYGVLSANCEGVFLQPTKYDAKATVSGTVPAPGKFERLDNKAVTFNGAVSPCRDDLYWWNIDGKRMIDFDEDDDIWGLNALTPSATLNLMLSAKGEDKWTVAGSKTVTGFGTNAKAGEYDEFVVRDVGDKSIRLAAEGSALADVVVTGVAFTQWRGDTYGEGDTTSFAAGEKAYGYPSNVVFTSGVIVPNEAEGYAHKVLLSARRTSPGTASSVRSPFFDGGTNADGSRRGEGLGMISFTYENAQTNADVLVQIATNGLRKGDSVADLTKSVDTNLWTTVARYDFSACTPGVRRRGVCTMHLGLHGVIGLMRVVVNPELVASVQSNKVSDATAFGEIEITKFVCRDEPRLDAADWWGWNVRTVACTPNSVGDDIRTYLPDGDPDAEAFGMPIALNCSVTEDVLPEDTDDLINHMPFVQTPTFTNNIVGEISFKARRYDNGDASQYAEVELYGAYSGQEGDDAQWVPLKQFIVSNTTYEAYSYRGVGTYSAFRLAVTGVKDVLYPGVPRKYDPAVRVLVDEVSVFEAVNPEMGFLYVYPFRDGMEETTACTNVVDANARPLPDAQPLCGESWTVQAEIMKTKLPDEIDMTAHPPRVIFHWFFGNYPWGYGKWRNDAKARSAELALADGETMVFRGSLPKARAAIVESTLDVDAPMVVQYSADVIYHTTSGLELTNSLVRNASTTWVRPSWYAPVDHNAGKPAVSAYTILDTIAPHRVWINEVNIWDLRNPVTFDEYADTNQYIEVAAPELQSLEGWRIEYISNDRTVNTLVRFTSSDTGDGYAPPKKDLKKVPAAKLNEYRTNDYVFLTVQSPKTRNSRTWDGVPGAIDGTWRDFNGFGGTLDQKEPVAIRLIRPSQIVEHEIVVEGTNTWATGRHPERDNPTNWIARVEDEVLGRKSSLFYVGNEDPNTDRQSIGVFRNTGAVSNDWKNLMVQTPGRVNEGQIIPYGYVLYANGDYLIVRARIGATGHILQTVADETETANEVTLMIRKGGEGTNITYTVANWWETAFVTTNGGIVAESVGKRGKWTLKNVGAGASNDLTVVATAQPFTELREKYGLTEDNRYTPAVMDWLEGGVNLFEEPFEHPGEIHLAEFRTPITDHYVTNLDLTTMYWLDIDPTVSNTWLKGGIVNSRHGGIHPIVLDDPPPAVTNFRMGVHMEITNLQSGVAYAPYVLRGLQPGQTSASYVGNWTSVTFKITGDIQITDPAYAGRERWVPLRWFVFEPKPGATSRVGASASFGDDFRSTVDVWDPKDESAAIYTQGWSAFPDANVFYRWALDGRNAPVTIETLRPESTYSE